MKQKKKKARYEYLAVLDFEATCEDRASNSAWSLEQQEIIELPVVLVRCEQPDVVDCFNSFVQPTAQPQLTDFCCQLTSITQADVDRAPTISEAVSELLTWFESRDLTAENTLVVTCGDWDLRSMWPRQRALVPELPHPDLFRTWCNLKKSFSERTGSKPAGMMGMLRKLGIAHQGHHHRGADDVQNLAQIAIHLLQGGARFEPTWTDADRAREQKVWTKKRNAILRALEAKRQELTHLPPEVSTDVESTMANAIEHLEAQKLYIERVQSCF